MKAALHSGYHLTQKAWNEGNKSDRQVMLTAAGHSKNDHYGRAFNYLPQYVRNDLINVQLRKAPPVRANLTPTKTAAKPVRDYWYNHI